MERPVQGRRFEPRHEGIGATERCMREILLVEDSDFDAELLVRMLKAARVANPVRHLRDGMEALQFLKQRENSSPVAEADMPAVLLLDLKLPRAHGFEILGYLEMCSAFDQMLKVVVSDLQRLQDIRTAYAMGAQSFLGKPVNQEDLTNLIARYHE